MFLLMYAVSVHVLENRLFWVVLGCFGLFWAVLGCATPSVLHCTSSAVSGPGAGPATPSVGSWAGVAGSQYGLAVGGSKACKCIVKFIVKPNQTQINRTKLSVTKIKRGI